MDALVSLLVIGGTTWVCVDASRLGAARGRLGGGLLDMGTGAWVFCCLLFFLIAFPCYLATRGRLVAARAAELRPAPAPGPAYRSPAGLRPPQVDPWASHARTADPSAYFTDPPPARDGLVHELEDVTRMHEQGHLTESEFTAVKARILRGSEA